MSFDPLDIIGFFYHADTPLRRLLIKHSTQVRDKALEIFASAPASSNITAVDTDFIATGALLHDIGIIGCHAPRIFCEGNAPYIAHGIIGGAMLRSYGGAHGVDLEPLARICERHTGTGITATEIREQHLPLPERDFLPETFAEQLICLADKFYSKSGDMKEKSIDRIRRSMLKFGPDNAARFEAMCRKFGLQ